jgi:hypothetical protein
VVAGGGGGWNGIGSGGVRIWSGKLDTHKIASIKTLKLIN